MIDVRKRLVPAWLGMDDRLIFSALSRDDGFEYAYWLKSRCQCVDEDYCNREVLPETQLFDDDATRLEALDYDHNMEFIQRLAKQRRYMIKEGNEVLGAPEIPDLRTNHGFFAEVSDELLKVKLWLSEFNSVCVTLLLDEFIKERMSRGGHFYIMPESVGYVGLDTLEQISSGIRVVNSGPSHKCDFIRIVIDEKMLEEELVVPNDFDFDYNKDEEFHIVKTESLGCRYCINFSVSGEFDMDIYYQPKDGPIRFLMSRGFYCK